MTRPTTPTPQAAATAYQRKRHALRIAERRPSSSSCMCRPPSENRFGNDDDVSRGHDQVLFDLAAVQQVIEAHADLSALAVHRSDDARAVAGREPRQPTDL